MKCIVFLKEYPGANNCARKGTKAGWRRREKSNYDAGPMIVSRRSSDARMALQHCPEFNLRAHNLYHTLIVIDVGTVGWSILGKTAICG